MMPWDMYPYVLCSKSSDKSYKELSKLAMHMDTIEKWKKDEQTGVFTSSDTTFQMKKN